MVKYCFTKCVKLKIFSNSTLENGEAWVCSKSKKKLEQSTAQSLFTQNTSKKCDLNTDFTEALLSANIPFYKVNNFKFKEF